MVLFFPGRSRCGICDDVIQASDPMQGFPAWIRFDHPLGRFSDAAFHQACFDADAERDAVLDLYARYQAIWDSRPRNLTSLEEMEAWGREAFKDLP